VLERPGALPPGVLLSQR